ncbi:MAG: hypothetical protein JNL79_03010 [Myxococcales bacterium]|nr:hypothetical protein [Myxococcales bacterium]
MSRWWWALLVGCGTAPVAAPPKPIGLPGHQPHASANPLVPTDLGTGCFAWSSKEPAVACVVGTESDQSGGVWSVVFVSDKGGRHRVAIWGGMAPRPTRVLPAADRRLVDERLDGGEFRAIPGSFTAVPAGPAATKVGGLALRLVREEQQHVKWPNGEWDVVVDRLEARCPDRKSWLVLREAKLEGPLESTAKAWVLDDKRILVVHEARWSMVGDKGASAVAVLVDLAECRAWTSEL